MTQIASFESSINIDPAVSIWKEALAYVADPVAEAVRKLGSLVIQDQE